MIPSSPGTLKFSADIPIKLTLTEHFVCRLSVEKAQQVQGHKQQVKVFS